MAGICTSSTRDSGGTCDHLTLDVTLDGSPLTVKTGRNDPRWNVALTGEELGTMLRLLSRWWKGKGADLAAFANRVLAGEEATNVKTYNLFGPGLAVTKTDVGTSYVNCLPGFEGEPSVIDFNGCTQLRLVVHVNHVGTGQLQMRVLRHSDDAVIYETPSAGAAAGEKRLDSDWQSLSANGAGQILVRMQIKSSVAGDDPVLRGAVLLVK